MRSTVTRLMAVLATAALVPACGGGSSGGAAIPAGKAGGGSASGSSTPDTTFGGDGGELSLWAIAAARFGVNPPPGAPPVAVPAAAATDTVITDLSSDVLVIHGNAVLNGTVTASGAAVRSITATRGDVVISGTLLGGQHLGTQIHVAINAPAGTVYVTGAVRTTSVDGVADGDVAGNVAITAGRIVLTGLIEARGEDGPAAGDGGLVVLDANNSGATEVLVVGGAIDTSGGNGQTSGGDAANIILLANREVRVHSTLRANGGSVSGSADAVTAGKGGVVFLEGPSGVSTNATIEAVGGNASTSGAGASAGNGGAFGVNAALEISGPSAIYGTINLAGGAASAGSADLVNTVSGGDGGVFAVGNEGDPDDTTVSLDMARADFDLRGGTSTDVPGDAAEAVIVAGFGSLIFQGLLDASAGSGGNGTLGGSGGIVLVTDRGDIRMHGTLRANGSSGAAVAGPSMDVMLLTLTNGSIFVDGTIEANAGSATAGDVDGGHANTNQIQVIVEHPAGSITFAPGSSFRNSGGRASGTGTGGDGGFPIFTTEEGPILLAGAFVANGGDAPGGTGGLGGSLWFRSDENSDGVGGDITIAATGTIDANGGAGAVGGNALLAYACRLDADGNNSNGAGNGVVQNLGRITTRGGSPGGNGGGVFFDGLKPNLTVGPEPGLQDRSAAPGGLLNGAFVSN